MLRDMRGSFTSACEVWETTKKSVTRCDRRDRGELRHHHEATDGAQPSAILQKLGLHLEVATDDKR